MECGYRMGIGRSSPRRRRIEMVKVEEEGKVVRIGSIMCRNSGMERCSASEV